MPVLPKWILDNILEQQVLPRLTLAVEEWNPLTDTVPIHTWTHPWLPLLGVLAKLLVKYYLIIIVKYLFSPPSCISRSTSTCQHFPHH